MPRAIWLIRPEGMTLPGNGLPVCGSIMVFGYLEKSPACIAFEGTEPGWATCTRLNIFGRPQLKKKKVLSLMIGPLTSRNCLHEVAQGPRGVVLKGVPVAFRQGLTNART